MKKIMNNKKIRLNVINSLVFKYFFVNWINCDNCDNLICF